MVVVSFVFSVPSSVALDGNNSLVFNISAERGENGYTLAHDASPGGDGKRWKLVWFPFYFSVIFNIKMPFSRAFQ